MTSFALPRPGTAAREACGDMAALAEALHPANARRLPTFQQALALATRDLAAIPLARSINILCLRADDQRWLIRVGRRGGWKRVWNFGTGRH